MFSGVKIELLLTVAAVVGVGVLVQLGWLSNTYAGMAIGALGGSGVRSIAGVATAPKVDPPAADKPA